MRRFGGLGAWPVTTAGLALLTGYWAWQGNGLMLAVSAVCCATAAGLWIWRARRRANALPVGLFPSGARFAFEPVRALFMIGWVAVLLGGLHAYGAGFSPATPLYPLIGAAGLAWTAAGLLMLRFSPHTFETARGLRRVLLVLGLVFVGGGVASGYALGWAYTQRYGDEALRQRNVTAKWQPLRAYGCTAYVEIDARVPFAPPHCVSAAYWSTLRVGAAVRTRERESPWGNIVNVSEPRAAQTRQRTGSGAGQR
jgi:hypothetical protein